MLGGPKKLWNYSNQIIGKSFENLHVKGNGIIDGVPEEKGENWEQQIKVKYNMPTKSGSSKKVSQGRL